MKLPIGISSFIEIRENKYIYVDKTKEAFEAISNYKYLFLSRPRRFGKSLFVDTLKHIFEGNKELFEGLYIYDKYDFEKYPVIKFSFKTITSIEDLLNDIKVLLKNNQENLKIECEKDLDYANCFDRLIKEAFNKYQKKVVILIDEYDKPILDLLDDLQKANKARDILKRLYSQIKENDPYIRFAFLTGITKFSKASIFSGLNNIFDISLMRKFGNICGYTESEIDENFKEYLEGVDRAKMKKWYNGYYFLKDRVYNPFDILKFFDNDYIFKSYWFESGSPYHLITLLKNQDFYLPELENVIVDDTILDTFDIEKIKLESLLFQAGYLTIDSYEEYPFGREYKLKVPNLEVQISLNRLILDYLTDKDFARERSETYKALLKEDIEKFKDILISLFASIPYNNYVKNSIAHFEGYYASVVYAFLNASGLDIIPEDVTNKGRIDLSIVIDDKVYIIEFKVVVNDYKMENGQWKMENEGEIENGELRIENERNEKLKVKSEKCGALEQIKEKKYYEKYGDKKIYLIGICFSEEERNIVKFEWERV